MNRETKIRLVRILAAALMLVCGIITEKLLPMLYIVSVVLYFVAYFTAGYDVIGNAAKNIKACSFLDENFLMCLATIGALIIGDYSEAVAVMVFYQIGELFSDIAVNNSRKSLKSLFELHPDYANLITADEIKQVAPESVDVGNEILIKPGERIPLDGIVQSGSSAIDVSAVLGESIPENVTVGDAVRAGCIVKDGALTVKVTAKYADSTIAKIIKLGETASFRKAKQETLVKRFARIYTPIVVLLAAALAFLPPFFGGEFAVWFKRALMFLVVSCPCALVVSVPLSFFCGTGKASQNGILIKGSAALENLSELNTVCFDKTGTLTDGNFTVSDVICEEMPKAEFLSLAAAVEKDSSHPIGKSIAESAVCKAEEIRDHKNYPGCGVSAVVDGTMYYAGTSKWLKEFGITCPDIEGIHFGKPGKYLGTVLLCDRVKPETKEVIKDLGKLGIENTVMLTGASDGSAEAVAKELNLDCHTKLMPEDKLNLLEERILSGESVAYVGDGINDVPVLARAKVGISMGMCGTDAAIEASDCVIMNDSLTGIVNAVKIAKRTVKVAKQNIVFSLVIKIGILILSAFGIGNMWTAVFGDVGVCVLAVLNATSLLKYNPQR